MYLVVTASEKVYDFRLGRNIGKLASPEGELAFENFLIENQ